MTKSGLYICLVLLLGTTFAVNVKNIKPNSQASIKVMAKNDSSIESSGLKNLAASIAGSRLSPCVKYNRTLRKKISANMKAAKRAVKDFNSSIRRLANQSRMSRSSRKIRVKRIRDQKRAYRKK